MSDQPPSSTGEQLEIAALIDEIADEMTKRGVGAAITDRYAALSDGLRYEEDEYKFNLFGVMTAVAPWRWSLIFRRSR
ncbi:hypothetical protein DQ393_32535 [Rhizobium tropici]|uniref:Uncharacterized protein n=1 Tax=Rhizobium tropici TaxID=398 RepID=A0A329Y0V3_RHITR|nr:hypothetical protein DQ393_32535 [Rhizobium tropici]